MDLSIQCALCHCPSVRLSVTRAEQSKHMKLGSCNFHRTVAASFYFLQDKFHPEIVTGYVRAGRQTT